MKSFVAHAFRVTFDRSGFRGAAPLERPDAPALVGLDIGDLRRDGQPVTGAAEPAVLDVDEVEQRWVAPGVAALEIRHGFVAGWRTRIVLVDLSDTAWTATFRLRLQPGPDHRGWRSATGAGGVMAVLPERADVSALAVRSGPGRASVHLAAEPNSLVVGPYRLGSGERLVTSWEWSTMRHPGRLGSQLRSAWPALPRRSTVAMGSEIWLPVDSDTAVVVPDDVATETLDDRLALVADEPGRHRVELRSARGVTELDLTWVPPVAEYLAGIAEHALSATPGPAGVVALPDLASAIVVQRAARTSGFPGVAAAEEALDQFTARLELSAADLALAAIYLAGEYDRLGDPELIERAGSALAAVTDSRPGLGLAVVRTVLATVLAGGSPTGRSGMRVPAIDHPTTAADLELLLATGSPDALVADRRVLDLVHRLGIELAVGLPGAMPIEADPSEANPSELAYAVAVLRLVPDAFAPWWRRHFGGSVAEDLDERSLDLVARLRARSLGSELPAVTPADAWLALGS